MADAMVNLELSGLKQVELTLQRLETRVQRQVASKALRAGLKIIEAGAERNAPIGHYLYPSQAARRTPGTLKKGISVRAGRRTKDAVTMVVGVGKRWFTGDEWYAAFVEFGHKVGKRTTRMEATAKRIAGDLRRESRAARAQGGGLAKKGTAKREQQEKFFIWEGRRRAQGGAKAAEVPGEHFIEYAYEELKKPAIEEIKRAFQRELEIAAAIH